MREVKLWELSGAALVVPESTGVFYTNQVNGTACEHPKLEGILIPVNNDMLSSSPEYLENQLCSLFDGSWNELTEIKANEINAVLSKFPETKGILVDRDKLFESVESWVYVIAKETEDSCYSGFGELHGILTWQNSD